MRALLATLVAAALSASAWSLFVAPLPIEILATLAGVYVVAVTSSVCLLVLGTFLDVHQRVDGVSDRIALSFDDGPHPVHTSRILDVLDAHDAKATFFVIGEKAAQHPEVLAEIARRGHELAVHSWSHDHHLYLRDPARIVDEIERTCGEVERATGRRPRLFRPPIGFSTPRTRAAVDLCGLRVAGWSVRAYDGIASASSQVVAERVARRAHAGAIVLLHDAAERGDREPASVGALPSILRELEIRGLRAVTVSELLDASTRAEVAAGEDGASRAEDAPAVG